MTNAALTGTSEFQVLMRLLQHFAHYSTVAGKAEREMIAERMRGNNTSADEYKISSRRCMPSTRQRWT